MAPLGAASLTQRDAVRQLLDTAYKQCTVLEESVDMTDGLLPSPYHS